jgi:hypothetical protein
MEIPVQQVAGTDGQPSDFDRISGLNNVDIGVRDRHAPGKELEPGAFGSGNVANGTIGDDGRAPKGAKDVHVHRSNQRTKTRPG